MMRALLGCAIFSLLIGATTGCGSSATSSSTSASTEPRASGVQRADPTLAPAAPKSSAPPRSDEQVTTSIAPPAVANAEAIDASFAEIQEAGLRSALLIDGDSVWGNYSATAQSDVCRELLRVLELSGVTDAVETPPPTYPDIPEHFGRAPMLEYLATCADSAPVPDNTTRIEDFFLDLGLEFGLGTGTELDVVLDLWGGALVDTALDIDNLTGVSGNCPTTEVTLGGMSLRFDGSESLYGFSAFRRWHDTGLHPARDGSFIRGFSTRSGLYLGMAGGEAEGLIAELSESGTSSVMVAGMAVQTVVGRDFRDGAFVDGPELLQRIESYEPDRADCQ
jgi:hypothetical protein